MEAVVDPQLQPTDFIAAVIRHAEANARDAAEFLRRRGVQTIDENGSAVGWPSVVLLGIGLSVQFRCWEVHHIRFHLDAGLPCADDVLARLATDSDLSALSDWVKSVWIRVIGIFRQSFVWASPDAGLGAEIALLAVADEPFLDRIVDLLWDLSQQPGMN